MKKCNFVLYKCNYMLYIPTCYIFLIPECRLRKYTLMHEPKLNNLNF